MAAARDDAKTPAARLIYLDALRGIACLAVLLYHNAGGMDTARFLHQPHDHGVRSLIYAGLGFGWLGVHMFLVLSGFCLFYPIVRKAPVSEARVDFRNFMTRRARRILPPYYCCIAVVFLISQLLRRPVVLAGRIDLPVHILMLQNLLPRTTVTINGAFWSLALEWQMYLLFPLFILWARRWGLLSLSAFAFALSAAWETFARHRIGLDPPWQDGVDWYHAVPGFAYVFIVGMYAAALVARPKRSYLAPAVAIAAIAAMPALIYAARVSMVGPLVDVAWGTIFAAIIVACASLPERHFVNRGLFTPLVSIGMFSYSLYLIHGPMLEWLDIIVRHFQIPGAEGQIWHWARILLVIGLAYLFFIAFERPFLVKRRNETAAEVVRDTIMSPAP